MNALTVHNVFETIDGWVALGTVGLAGATTVLALMTRKTAARTQELAEETKTLAQSTEQEVQAVIAQADAARQEVEVSREALQATYRPRLVDVPYGRFVRQMQNAGALPATFDDARIVFNRDRGVMIVPVRNVGTGLALLQDVGLRWHEPGSLTAPAEVIYLGTVTPSVLPPGEFARITFDFGVSAQRMDSITELGMFGVEVEYEDVTGQVAQMTRLDIARKDNEWKVRQVHFYAAEGNEPYASSGVSV